MNQNIKDVWHFDEKADKNEVVNENEEEKMKKIKMKAHARCTRIICLAHFCDSFETCYVHIDQIFMAVNTIFNIGFEIKTKWNRNKTNRPD